MQHLVLDIDNLTMTSGGKSISLLPKEFALLQFLHAHPNRTFSREELLNAVWPLETPVDRTVDDHVYRLRKKLAEMPHSNLALETVRGRGYRLSTKVASAPRPPKQPTLHNGNYREHIRYLFNTYVRDGYGQGLSDLRENAEVFGIHTDPTLEMRSRFFAGDFRAVVEDTTFAFREKAFCLLSMYSFMQFDYAKTLHFYQRAIETYVLPTESHLEVLCFHIPIYSFRAGYTEQALASLSDTFDMALTYPLDGFIPLLRLEDALFSLYQGHIEEAERKLQEANRVLLTAQWNRELAFYKIIQGFVALAKNKPIQAEHAIDKGLAMLQDINIVNHVLIRTHDVLYFLRHCVPNEHLRMKYERIWGELSLKYDFPVLEEPVLRILDDYL